jgi:hypothetical protein
MPTWTGTTRLNGLLGAAATVLAITLATPAAEAGQPWSCSCNGKPKRFIASTNACEWSQPKNQSARKLPNRRSKMIPCTRAEFVTWNRKACVKAGCTLPRRVY